MSGTVGHEDTHCNLGVDRRWLGGRDSRMDRIFSGWSSAGLAARADWQRSKPESCSSGKLGVATACDNSPTPGARHGEGNINGSRMAGTHRTEEKEIGPGGGAGSETSRRFGNLPSTHTE